MMIEEPDWEGVQQRFGSIPCLLDEIAVVRAALAEADPSVERTAEIDTAAYSLAAANLDNGIAPRGYRGA